MELSADKEVVTLTEADASPPELAGSPRGGTLGEAEAALARERALEVEHAFAELGRACAVAGEVDQAVEYARYAHTVARESLSELQALPSAPAWEIARAAELLAFAVEAEQRALRSLARADQELAAAAAAFLGASRARRATAGSSLRVDP